MLSVYNSVIKKLSLFSIGFMSPSLLFLSQYFSRCSSTLDVNPSRIHRISRWTLYLISSGRLISFHWLCPVTSLLLYAWYSITGFSISAIHFIKCSTVSALTLLATAYITAQKYLLEYYPSFSHIFSRWTGNIFLFW